MADEKVPDMYEVNWKGKTHFVTRDDFDTVKSNALARLRPYVDRADGRWPGVPGPSFRRGVVDSASAQPYQVFALKLDLGARPFAEQDAVTGLDRRCDQLARVLAGTLADRDDLALGGLFLGGVGDDETALGLVFAFDAADQHTVMQRFECHL